MPQKPSISSITHSYSYSLIKYFNLKSKCIRLPKKLFSCFKHHRWYSLIKLSRMSLVDCFLSHQWMKIVDKQLWKHSSITHFQNHSLTLLYIFSFFKLSFFFLGFGKSKMEGKKYKKFFSFFRSAHQASFHQGF